MVSSQSLEGGLERRPGVERAVARDEDVEPAERLDRVLEATPEVVPVGEVGADGGPADAGGGFVRGVRSAEDRDPRSRSGERLGDPEADAAAAAGDERAATGEVEERRRRHRARRYST